MSLSLFCMRRRAKPFGATTTHRLLRCVLALSLLLGAWQPPAVLAAGTYDSLPVSPGNTFDVGSITVGFPIANTLIIRNLHATETLTVTFGSFTGAHAADFSIISPANFTSTPLIINPSSSKSLTIQCVPSAAGLRTAQLNLTSSDTGAPTPTYPLTCTGLVPTYTSAPPPNGAINFGSTGVGVSVTSTILITNTGQGTLVVNGFGKTGDVSEFNVLSSFPFSINPNQMRTIIVECKPTTLGAFAATLSVSSNDPANQTVTYNLACSASDVNLSVTKSASPDPVTAGQLLTYTIVVANLGITTTASSVILTDTLPPSTTVSSLPPGCSGATLIVCNMGSLAPNTSTTQTLVVLVHPSALGSLLNVVRVTAAQYDTAFANNVFTQTTTVIGGADLSMSKSDGQTTVTAGTPITYTIVVANAGPSSALGATVSDTLPASLLNPTWTCSASIGSSCPASGSGAIVATVNIIPNGSLTFIVVGTLDSNASGTLVNTASVAPPLGTTDPIAANNVATDTTTISGASDLSVSKDDGLTSAIPGANIAYTLIVTNSGPSAAPGALITDIMPSALTNVTWTCSASVGSSCPASGSGHIIATLNLLVNGTATFNIAATIASTATGSLVNSVSVTPAAGATDPNNANNNATDNDTLTPQTDLGITKTDGQTSATPGAQVVYAIVITNAGPSGATGVTVQDTFVASLTGVTWSCAASANASCNTASGSSNITTTVDFVSVGAITFTVTGTLDVNATGGLTNTASLVVPGGVTDLNPSNNSATDFDTMPTDLGISKDDGQTTAVPGLPLTYTIVITNAGPTRVVAAPVNDTFGGAFSSVTWTCAASAGSACVTTAGSGDIATTVDIAVNGSLTFTVVATVSSTATGSLINTANVTTPFGVSDTNPNTNSATDTDTLTPQVELGISKSDGVTNVIAGTPVTYTIVITNAGPSAAQSALVTDTLPAILQNATWSCIATNGACPASGVGDIATTIDVSPNGIVTFTLNATVASTATGSLVNTASVGAASGVTDTDTSNNSATDTNTLTTQADVLVTATFTPNPAFAGGLVTTTFTITNMGPSAAANIVFTDTLSSNATFVGASASCSGVTVIVCNLGTMLPNAPTIITVVVTTLPTFSGVITHTASALGTDPDANLANNTVIVPIPVILSADLRVVKLDSLDPVSIGGSLLYTIVVTNGGPSDASNVVVSDTLPTQLFFVSASTACSGTTVITCALGALTANSTALITIAVTTDPNARGVIVNPATATASEFDPNLLDNSGVQTTTIFAQAELAISKQVTPSSVYVNNFLTYTLVLTNNGPTAAAQARFTDALPSGATFYSLIASPDWFCSAPVVGASGNVICYAPTFTNGLVSTFTLVVRAPNTAGTAINVATISSDDPDPNLTNNTAMVNTEVSLYAAYLPLILKPLPPQPDLVGSFSLTPPTTVFTAGQPVTITVIVTNQGGVFATPFWVDFYINPSTPPTGPNVPWNEVCALNPCFGLAWYVAGGLAPGQRITLTSVASSYETAYSNWRGWFANGSSDLYVFVDSWNRPVGTGAVVESNETNNRAELHGLSVTGPNPPYPRNSDIPPRPTRR